MQGRNASEVAELLGITKATVCYHKRRLGLSIDERFAFRYDWDEVRRYYELGHTRQQCQARFGFSKDAWRKAVKRGYIVQPPRAKPLADVLVRESRYPRFHLKTRLLAEGLKENRCEECGISTWRGRPLSMALHHVNGDGRDNRLENLAMLCPNCHSQTPNFGVKNWRARSGEGAGVASTAAHASAA